MAPDGNCFFRVVADHIEGKIGDHVRIRQQVVDHVEANEEGYARICVCWPLTRISSALNKRWVLRSPRFDAQHLCLKPLVQGLQPDTACRGQHFGTTAECWSRLCACNECPILWTCCPSSIQSSTLRAASINTLMVMTGCKNAGHFAFTSKAGGATEQRDDEFHAAEVCIN